MKRVKMILALLTVLSMLGIGSIVYAEGEEDEENYDESYYSEETYEDEEDDDTEYNGEDEYEEDDETYGDEDENNEDEEYIEESYEEESEEESSILEEETVSEVSVEESSEPIINNDPLKWQKDIDTIIPADAGNYVSPIADSKPEEKKQTEKTVSEESKAEGPVEEKVLNIADIAEKEDDNISFITGVVLWIFVLFLAAFLFIIFANTKSVGNIPRKRYYKSPRKITKRHIK